MSEPNQEKEDDVIIHLEKMRKRRSRIIYLFGGILGAYIPLTIESIPDLSEIWIFSLIYILSFLMIRQQSAQLKLFLITHQTIENQEPDSRTVRSFPFPLQPKFDEDGNLIIPDEIRRIMPDHVIKDLEEKAKAFRDQHDDEDFDINQYK